MRLKVRLKITPFRACETLAPSNTLTMCQRTRGDTWTVSPLPRQGRGRQKTDVVSASTSCERSTFTPQSPDIPPRRNPGGNFIMSINVYMADLRHNFGRGLSTDCMPLAVGYMKAVMDRDLPDVQSRIFAYPDRLSEAIINHKPDVVMVGNYVWNEAIGLHFASSKEV